MTEIVTKLKIHKNKNKTIEFIIIEKEEEEEKEDKGKEKEKEKDVKEPLKIIKPILKWVGGKTQILDKLLPDFPKEMNNYHEIFLGGGSVLLALLTYVKNGIIKINGNIYAYDLNDALICMYKNIQTNHNELYDCVQVIINEMNECATGPINRIPKNLEEAKENKENYYYWMRSKYNNLTLHEKNSVYGSAMFIFLNKTCFRGIFRVGPRGFNVPYGNNKNPEIINKLHLDEIHDLIQGVIFKCCDFTESMSTIETNDFVYLDPPYAPETVTSFVKYTESGFALEKHELLFETIQALSYLSIKMMMSNADVSLVRENFTNCGEDKKYTVNSILCKRKINSKNPDAKALEVIIKNY
jgi:DNA adenine methylase